jgi:hypothetical protein
VQAQGRERKFNFEFDESTSFIGGVSSFDKTKKALKGLRDWSENILLTLNDSQENTINNFKTE